METDGYERLYQPPLRKPCVTRTQPPDRWTSWLLPMRSGGGGPCEAWWRGRACAAKPGRLALRPDFDRCALGHRVPDLDDRDIADRDAPRSEEHTSELQSPYVISYAVFCLK